MGILNRKSKAIKVNMATVTAKIAAPISGDVLYQIRAREALPLLVRQAEARQQVFFLQLAEELGMPNPRNLNYVLGSIGKTIENLSKVWKEKILPIQCLVVNKNTGLPGEGVGWFLRSWGGDFAKLPCHRQKDIVVGEHALIFAYPRWRELLNVLKLQPIELDFSSDVEAASSFKGRGGEGDAHRALKEFVAKHPSCVGLHKKTPLGENEVDLPSGDCLDVSFHYKDQWIAVEVKTALSNRADIVRGLFQCVKYRAVMAAVQAVAGKIRDVRAILALEGTLPLELMALRNTLGVELVETVNAAK